MMKHLCLAGLMALPASALAIELDLAGECPGPVTVDVTSVTPGGTVFVVAADRIGSATIPVGNCAGTNLGIAGALQALGPIVDTDGDGAIMRAPTVSGPLCGRVFVAVDMASCSVSAPQVFTNGTGCSGGQMNAWVNPGFELGGLVETSTSGSGESVTSVDAASGTYSAELTNGGAHLYQTFDSAIPVSSLTSARWRWWADTADFPISLVEAYYSDGSTSNNLFMTTSFGVWTVGDMLPFLTPGKSLTGLRIYGYSGGSSIADIVRLDDFQFCY